MDGSATHCKPVLNYTLELTRGERAYPEIGNEKARWRGLDDDRLGSNFEAARSCNGQG